MWTDRWGRGVFLFDPQVEWVASFGGRNHEESEIQGLSVKAATSHSLCIDDSIFLHIAQAAYSVCTKYAKENGRQTSDGQTVV